MSNPVDYTNNPANSSESAYLGFWNDVELYDRFGTTHTYKIGSFLIAITDLPVAELLQRFKNIQTEISDSVITEYDHGPIVPINYEQANVTQIDVAQISATLRKACLDSYECLHSAHPILGDTFICITLNTMHSLFNSRISDRRKYPYVSNEMALLSDMLRIALHENYNKFMGQFYVEEEFLDSSFVRLLDTFVEPRFVHEKSFIGIMEALSYSLVSYLAGLKYLAEAFTTIISDTLIRVDPPQLPILRYKNSTDLLNSLLTSFVPVIWSAFALHRSPTHFEGKKLIKDSTADIYDEAKGYRLIEAFYPFNTYTAALAEFEYMCANNIELACCKNCGKFFLPVSSASSFCDRPLDNDPSQTCKSLSGKWLSEHRRNSNPAWDEYMTYRSRYNSRTSRNKVKNPPARFAKWNIEAKELVHKYTNDEITLEAFSQKLKEMDDHMKPLDKM